MNIVAASGMTGFIAWVGIAISHFRRAFDKQNYDKSKIKYKASYSHLVRFCRYFMCNSYHWTRCRFY